MTWQPGVSFVGGELMGNAIQQGAQTISQDAIKAWDNYQQRRQLQGYNEAALSGLTTVDPTTGQPVPRTDAQGNPLIAPDLLTRYAKTNNVHEQSGIIMGALGGIATRQKSALEAAQTSEAAARATMYGSMGENMNLSDDQRAQIQAAGGMPVPSGRGGFKIVWPQGGNFTPDAAAIQRGQDVGKVWLPQSGGSGQWADMPDRPVDPNNVAVRDLGGGEKLFFDRTTNKIIPSNQIQRPSSEVEVIKAAAALGGNAPVFPAAGASPTPTPTPAPPVKVNSRAEAEALPVGTRYVTPDGQRRIR